MSSSNDVLVNSVEFTMVKSLRTSIKRMTSSKAAFDEICRNQTINGTFRKLCDDKQLLDILFPGTSSDILAQLPKNLREVLSWNDLEFDIVQIAKNASEVLNNIKIKGVKRGDVMDLDTEQVLIPQIALEALANGIIVAVRNLNRKASHMAAKLTLSVASMSAEQASFDQLDDSAVLDVAESKKHSTQFNFLGQEWSNLVGADIARYFRDEITSEVDKFGRVCTDVVKDVMLVSARMCWIESGEQLLSSYPAIAELVDQLHALPYELNAKLTDRFMPLLEPSKGCTMLLHFPRGAEQAFRVDSRSDGGSGDSGIRVTCAYHIVPAEGEKEGEGKTDDLPSRVVLTHVRDPANSTTLDICDDMLLLHQSVEVANARPAAYQDYYAVMFFIHGKQL